MIIAALSMDAWNPNAPRLEKIPMKCLVVDVADNYGQQKPRYIPTCNVKLYKCIDNYRILMYIVNTGAMLPRIKKAG